MQAPISRPRTEPAVDLPAAVVQVLRKLPDAKFRDRLYRVLASAARTIVKLRELNLARVEELAGSGDGSDLAMWEEIAPSVGASISDVNALLRTIQDVFPDFERHDSEDNFDLAFGPSSVESEAPVPSVPTTPEEKATAAEKAIQHIAESIKSEVSRFGKRVRNPSIVADRWNLLIDLQEFRGKCRAAVRELVFSSVSTFAELNRAVVVPEYAADLDEALVARHAWSTLTRAIGPMNARLQNTSADQQRPVLIAIKRELDHFRASRGYARMRAGDKRFAMAFARDLDDTLAAKRFGKSAQTMVEGFAKFLDSMAVLNRREILINHDREAFAECGTLLEQASSFLQASDSRRAAIRLTQAQAVATRLFGRDRALDDYLILRLRWPLENLVETAISEALEELRVFLADAGSHAPATMF